MKHWKKEGTGIGLLRTSFMHGEIYYLTGGGIPFFTLKVIRRVIARPFALGAVAMVLGYLAAIGRRLNRLVTEEEARHYRALLNRRLVKCLNPRRA
jgi:hypothetical protein